MRHVLWLVFCLVLLSTSAGAQSVLSLKAADGVSVTGSHTAAKGQARATILLFHQAGSNRFEYETIAPRLAALGYDVMAIDQRSGATRYGHPNETVAALGRSTSYDEALPDLEAALAHARASAPGRPIIVWGSSYSAALVFPLAQRFAADISAVLAFSPGEYLQASSVAEAARGVKVPIFVTSSSDEGEIAAARAILAASPSKFKTQFAPTAGVHGSSTLRDDANPEGAAAAWMAVEAFLAKTIP